MSIAANAALVRRIMEAFADKEGFALRNAFAEDAVWHVPGSSAMAGDYRGRDEIVTFLRRTAELTGGTHRVELLWVVADDEHTVAVYRARGHREAGRRLDIEQALLIELRDRLWARVRAQPLDQTAFDAFWAS